MNTFPHAKNFSKTKKKIRVACVGDSITQGEGSKLTPFFSYPSILQRKVGKKFSIRNFGKNGATTMYGLPDSYVNHRFYQQILDNNPDVIIFMFGTNDSKVGVWQNSHIFTKYYNEILDSFAKLSSNPRIILMTPPKPYKFERAENYFYFIRDTIIIDEIIPAIQEIAKERNLELIDIYSLTSNHRSWFIYDGIHPAAGGNRKIANAVVNKLISRE
ncbi:MAG: hypothetical protein BKP49_00130 [Treponema sp. CETP13]|nr:MAG: hypothetical protein BKP49_00130 [Treponema sp. CETP13]